MMAKSLIHQMAKMEIGDTVPATCSPNAIRHYMALIRNIQDNEKRFELKFGLVKRLEDGPSKRLTTQLRWDEEGALLRALPLGGYAILKYTYAERQSLARATSRAPGFRFLRKWFGNGTVRVMRVE